MNEDRGMRSFRVFPIQDDLGESAIEGLINTSAIIVALVSRVPCVDETYGPA
jgi:hypothetical protein